MCEDRIVWVATHNGVSRWIMRESDAPLQNRWLLWHPVVLDRLDKFGLQTRMLATVGKDAFETRDEARRKAEELRQAEVRYLRSELEDLESRCYWKEPAADA